MEAVTEFERALAEVDSLVAISRSFDPASPNRHILVKASLLLLAAKLECFFESVVEEYCEGLCTKESAIHLPHAVKVSASRLLFLESRLAELESLEVEKANRLFAEIVAIWSDTRPCPQISIDSKFAYGKHGETQVIRLFRRIGIENVFEAFLIEDETESLASPEGPKSIAPDFNSLSSLRNNIIHTDAAPAMTEEDIIRYKRRMYAFAEKLGAHLDASVAMQQVERSWEI
jgi:hypothetical protein